jgi:hypothetical protein
MDIECSLWSTKWICKYAVQCSARWMQHSSVNVDDFRNVTFESLSVIVPLREIFVPHLFCIRNICVLMLRDVSRGFPEPPRRVTLYCLERGYDQFLSQPFVSTSDCVQWPSTARSISFRLSLEEMRERLVLPSARIARTVLPQSVNMKH